MVRKPGASIFFHSFEQAIKTGDPSELAHIYNEDFLFGASIGPQTVSRIEFLKAIGHKSGFLKDLGLLSTRVVSVDVSPMDADYTLARVEWEMEVEKDLKPAQLVRVEASYILHRLVDGFKVVAQIDHDDLAEKIRAL